MPITITDPEIERLARALASVTGEPMAEALATALRERLARVRDTDRPSDAAAVTASADTAPAEPTGAAGNLASIAGIQAFVAALPELDSRTPEAILGYDPAGLPR